MKKIVKYSMMLLIVTISSTCYSQEIRTVFRNSINRASGGYGALQNKFTKIGGQYANMAGVYGGWYVNHKFTLGISAAAVTNNLSVPDQYSVSPGNKMSYAYGQFGLLTEYVVGSNRVIHVGLQLFSGSGFTAQYVRNYHDNYEYDFDEEDAHDTNFFYVAEPGINLELNVFKWMRFCTGVSYRAAFESDAMGMRDKDINGTSLNFGLKFGKF